MDATMRQQWTELGERWLAEHPVMPTPAGFVLDPAQLGPSNKKDEGPDGWFLTDDEGDMLYAFRDGPMARALIVGHAEDPKVVQIELWHGTDRVWVAIRP